MNEEDYSVKFFMLEGWGRTQLRETEKETRAEEGQWGIERAEGS